MQYFGEPEGRVKIQMMRNSDSPKFSLAKVFYLSRGRGNETSTNIARYLYSTKQCWIIRSIITLRVEGTKFLILQTMLRT